MERSVDAHDFRLIGSVKTNVNAAVFTSYSWFDEKPENGNNFYRIKSINSIGEIKYSEVVKVAIKIIDKSIAVYPNPVHGNSINLFLKNIDKGNYGVKLINSAGETVYTGNVTHSGGTGYHAIKLNNILPQGSYQLQMFYDNKLENISIIVQ